jgi:quinol monooxygenase YgiN
MDKFGLLVKLVAKPGKEAKLAKFLRSGLDNIKNEKGTNAWYAIHIEGPIFGIFDTFADEAARNAHLGGPFTQVLIDNAQDLLLQPPTIEKVGILACKPGKG